MLYFANMKIAQAFHPLLSAFEVILRNQLHYALARHFSDGSWIINQKMGFMVAPTLTYLNKRTKRMVTNDYLLREVQKAEKKIASRGTNITAGRVIAEQTIGFWNSLYEVHHYALLCGVPGTIFKELPREYGRKEINDVILRIRELRNRINHNEPICFVNKKCDFSYVKDMYRLISQFLSWIDPAIMPSFLDRPSHHAFLTRSGQSTENHIKRREEAKQAKRYATVLKRGYGVPGNHRKVVCNYRKWGYRFSRTRFGFAR